jgi:hypothetical protein
MALAIKKYSLFLPCPPEHRIPIPSLLHLVNIKLIDQCFVEIILMPMHMGMGKHHGLTWKKQHSPFAINLQILKINNYAFAFMSN